MTVTVPLLIGALTLVTAYLFTPRKTSRVPPDALQSIVIPAYTSHARHLPKPSRHAFSYPLLYVGVDIDSLQTGLLDLPRRLFGYGGRPWTKVLGLRSDGYLQAGRENLRAKVEQLLGGHGIAKEEIAKVWLVTMPSFLGFEGINPLSVWYIYNSKRELRCVILEVHNTFGEKHAYVLKTESEHRHEAKEGYDLAWTFPRSFHVSPFNSRNGYYRLDLLDPFSPTTIPGTLPQISVFLRLLTPSKECKLQANLASSPSTPSVPLDSDHLHRILWTLLRFPMALLLTTPRILYQAYRLHYERDLAVYPRPEPKSQAAEQEWNAPQTDKEGLGMAVGWQKSGWGEKTARDVVIKYCQTRAYQLGVGLDLQFLDQRPHLSIGPTDNDSEVVRVRTADPKFFTDLLLAPSPRQFTILAPELLTTISNPELFIRFFTPETELTSTPMFNRMASRIRYSFFQFLLSHSIIAPTPDLWLSPDGHFTDFSSSLDQFRVFLVVLLAVTAERAEERIMNWMGATFVEGREPWMIWDRAVKRHDQQGRVTVLDLGSGAGSEDWTLVEKDDLGSKRIHR